MTTPLVYLDSSCFGTLVADFRVAENVQACFATRSLLMAIEARQLRFAVSAWLLMELRATKPAAKRRLLLSSVPSMAARSVLLSAEIKRSGRDWEAKLGIDYKDALHVASAIETESAYLITRDKDLYEKCRQKSTLLSELVVLPLTHWIEGIA